MANSAEYMSLLACTQGLVDGLVAQGPKTMSDLLVSEGLISYEVYQAVASDKTPQDRGRELVQGVTAFIRHNSSHFNKLLAVLDQNGANSLVKLLQDKCKYVILCSL